MSERLPRVLVLLVAAVGAVALVAQSRAERPCETATFEGARFTVCRASAERHELRLVWRGRDGAPLLKLERLEAHLGPDARRVRFAMNAGMYETDRAPLGLYVEGGAELRRLRTEDGSGNFYLKPNGVFSQDGDGRFRVETSEAYAARKAAPALATQSGPMLLIDGALHPRIQPDGASRYIRNAVGVTEAGEAAFVISEGRVSFGKLARFMRQALGCRDALYLDGSVSGLWAPRQDRLDATPSLGPMIVVLDRANGPR